jgi:3-methylcrotonyl-CoA carboxylase alpha subunit
MKKHTLLVANRGEIACRVLRSARALSLRTIAVYSQVDRELPHVQMADVAVEIGPARPAESYLNTRAVLDAAEAHGATMIHPGYGFLSENPAFASACAQAGIQFVGPSPEVIGLMGDKDQARQTAATAGVPVLPGSGKLNPADPADILVAGEKTGFPLLVKAAAGGGGIGMRTVSNPDELVAAVAATSGLAQKAFGDGAVYLERFVERARHVEIQLFGFGDGQAIHLFERDCSLQRRHQKVIEEARAPQIQDAVRTRIAEAAVQLARACKYQGAGTVEFLYDSESQEFFFLEMNTRIQVEHPANEMITGVDLVAAQLRLAMGERLHEELAQDQIKPHGHAIEARVYAENPAKNFLPSPGLLSTMRLPSGEDVRVDTGYAQGNRITPFYDPMVMKVIAYAADRDQAINRLDLALAQTHLEGIAHNIGYLRSVLKHPAFRAGQLHTGFLGQFHGELVA